MAERERDRGRDISDNIYPDAGTLGEISELDFGSFDSIAPENQFESLSTN